VNGKIDRGKITQMLAEKEDQPYSASFPE
jgi:hypothetical protein